MLLPMVGKLPVEGLLLTLRLFDPAFTTSRLVAAPRAVFDARSRLPFCRTTSPVKELLPDRTTEAPVLNGRTADGSKLMSSPAFEPLLRPAVIGASIWTSPRPLPPIVSGFAPSIASTPLVPAPMVTEPLPFWTMLGATPAEDVARWMVLPAAVPAFRISGGPFASPWKFPPSEKTRLLTATPPSFVVVYPPAVWRPDPANVSVASWLKVGATPPTQLFGSLQRVAAVVEPV